MLSREVRGLEAFLTRVGATRVEEYLCRFGRDPVEGLERRLRWAAWHFSDPEHAEEAQFLIAYHGALREKLSSPPLSHPRGLMEADTVLLDERPRPAWSPKAAQRRDATPDGPPPPPPKLKTVTPTPPPHLRTITPTPPPLRNVTPTPPPAPARTTPDRVTQRLPAVTLPIERPTPVGRAAGPAVGPLLLGVALMSASIGALVASVVLWWAAWQAPPEPVVAGRSIATVVEEPPAAPPAAPVTAPDPVGAPDPVAEAAPSTDGPPPPVASGGAAAVPPRPVVPAPALPAPDLTGTWEGPVEGSADALRLRVYRQVGERFAGWASVQIGGVPSDGPISGRWDPASGTVRMDTPDGAVRLEARLEGGALTGTWHRGADGTIHRFTLRRRP